MMGCVALLLFWHYSGKGKLPLGSQGVSVATSLVSCNNLDLGWNTVAYLWERAIQKLFNWVS